MCSQSESIQCEENYYRCIVPCWRISIGWCEIFITLGITATTIMGTIASLGNIGPQMSFSLGIATVIVGSVTTISQALKQQGAKTVSEESARLRDVETGYGIIKEDPVLSLKATRKS